MVIGTVDNALYSVWCHGLSQKTVRQTLQIANRLLICLVNQGQEQYTK